MTLQQAEHEFPDKEWKQRVDEISKSRTWNELLDHFRKHVNEMEHLDAKKYPDRAEKKAFSLVNLCVITILKMGAPLYFVDFFDAFPHNELLDRITAHDQFLLEQAERERKEKEAARKKAEAEIRKKESSVDDNDTD